MIVTFIHLLKCKSCENNFYELHDKSLDVCPNCGTSLVSKESTEELWVQEVLLNLNNKTGDFEIVIDKVN